MVVSEEVYSNQRNQEGDGMNQFSRTEMLLGKPAMAKLAQSAVAVFGIGGVGGYAAEALARSGVGHIALVDDDTLCETNINRQIIATHETIGRAKIAVMAERIRAINPAALVTEIHCFYSAETPFDLAPYDYLIDAVDTVSAKLLLVEEAAAAGVPIISCMGTGNKLDPTRLEVADIYQTEVCPLAKVMRKEIRARGIRALKVVYSKEPPLTPSGDEAYS